MLRNLKSYDEEIGRVRGSAMIAINEHLSYYNVRMKPVMVLAGQEVQIKVRPTKHMTSERFREFGTDVRKCLFPDESQVTTKNYYCTYVV